VTSSASPLTVLSTQGASTYQAALLAAGPWAYYPLNETGDPSTNNLLAYDNAGAYNGVYGTNVSNGFIGVAGPRAADGFPGFVPNNDAASHTDPYKIHCWIPVALELNTDTATMLAWVNPTDRSIARHSASAATTVPWLRAFNTSGRLTQPAAPATWATFGRTSRRRLSSLTPSFSRRSANGPWSLR
jgi:hypothetical protein